MKEIRSFLTCYWRPARAGPSFLFCVPQVLLLLFLGLFWHAFPRKIDLSDWPLFFAPFSNQKVKSSSRWPFDYLWVVILIFLKSRRRASFCNQCNRMTRLNSHPTNQPKNRKRKKHLMRTCSCACVKQMRGALLGGRPSPVTRRETAPARNCSGKHPWGENRKSEQYLPGALSLLLEEGYSCCWTTNDNNKQQQASSHPVPWNSSTRRAQPGRNTKTIPSPHFSLSLSPVSNPKIDNKQPKSKLQLYY